MTDHYGHKQLLKGLNHIFIGVTSIVKTILLTVLQRLTLGLITNSNLDAKLICIEIF